MKPGKSGLPSFLIVLFGLLLALGLPAALADNLELAVGNTTGLPGATVQVPVSLSSAGQVTMLQFDLDYSHEVLDWQGVTLAGGLGPGFSADANLVNGRVRVMVYNTGLQQLPAGTQTIITLTFGVAAGASLGQASTLELHDVLLADAGQNDLAAQAVLTGGLVSIPPPVTLKLAVGNGPGWAGGTVQAPVYLTSDGQVEGLQFDLSYDNQLITAVTVAPGSGLDPAFTVAANPVGGALRVLIYDSTGLQQIPGDSQPVAILTLELAAGLESGSTVPLQLQDVLVSGGGQDITAQTTVTDGLITVSAAGDLNGDGRINLLDVAMLGKAYGLQSSNDRWAVKYDLVADGVIDWRDLADLADLYGSL